MIESQITAYLQSMGIEVWLERKQVLCSHLTGELHHLLDNPDWIVLSEEGNTSSASDRRFKRFLKALLNTLNPSGTADISLIQMQTLPDYEQQKTQAWLESHPDIPLIAVYSGHDPKTPHAMPARSGPTFSVYFAQIAANTLEKKEFFNKIWPCIRVD